MKGIRPEFLWKLDTGVDGHGELGCSIWLLETRQKPHKKLGSGPKKFKELSLLSAHFGLYLRGNSYL
jgi:hypothetical protein